jgi:hypothetical protein
MDAGNQPIFRDCDMTEPCVTVPDVRTLDGYCVELTFSDGVRGTVDLANRIVGRGGVFGPLEKPDFFRRVTVDNDMGTIVWPNGADFCPDLLHRWAMGETGERPQPERIAP